MIEASELTQRILAELEHAGSDNLHSILNTVVRVSGAINEVETLKKSLGEIINHRLGYLALERMFPRSSVRLDEAASHRLVENLDGWFRFDETERYWTLGNGDPLKVPYPVLSLSDAGFALAREILGGRGNRWWLNKSGQI